MRAEDAEAHCKALGKGGTLETYSVVKIIGPGNSRGWLSKHVGATKKTTPRLIDTVFKLETI